MPKDYLHLGIHAINKTRLFPILLKGADKDDLLAVMENPNYASIDELVKVAIEEALPKAERGGTRTANLERARITKETFAELSEPEVPLDLVGIMSSYLTGKEPEKTKKEGRTETQEA